MGVHLGPRSENFNDLVNMDYLILNSGCKLKFTYLRYKKESKFITKDQYDKLNKMGLDKLSSAFINPVLKEVVSKKNGNTYYLIEYSILNTGFNDIHEFLYLDKFSTPSNEYKLNYSKIVRSNEDIDKSFGYFLKTKVKYGLDYETSGIPFDDPEFFHMGVAIASETGIAAYYDLEWMQSVGNNYEYFKLKYREFLDKYHNSIYTYNVGFEIRCTYLMLSELYDFHDSSTLNILDGNNYKRFSLKYTAMNNLNIPSWDDYFDDLLTRLPELFKSTKAEYKTSKVYLDMIKDYGNQEEFDRLLDSYWGYMYKCIPSEILGKYCILDSYYTVKLRNVSDSKYSDLAWNIFNDNNKLGALLEIDGYLKDEKLCDELSDKSMFYIVYSGLNLAKYNLEYDLGGYFNSSNSNDEFENAFSLGVNPLSSKDILKAVFDESNGYDRNINLDKLSLLGDSYYMFLLDLIDKNDLILNKNLFRKRSLFTSLDSELVKWWNYSEIATGGFKIGEVFYEESLSELINKSSIKNNLKIVNSLLEVVKIDEPKVELITKDGTNYNIYELEPYLKSLCNIISPISNPIILSKIYSGYYPMIKKIFGTPENANKNFTYDDVKSNLELFELTDELLNKLDLSVIDKLKNDTQVIKDLNPKEYYNWRSHHHDLHYFSMIRDEINKNVQTKAVFVTLQQYDRH
jgi:hypothetical protein